MAWPTLEQMQRLAESVDAGLVEVGRVRARDLETMSGWPTGYSMTAQLREALGLSSDVLEDPSPDSVLKIWEETMTEVRRRSGG